MHGPDGLSPVVVVRSTSTAPAKHKRVLTAVLRCIGRDRLAQIAYRASEAGESCIPNSP